MNKGKSREILFFLKSGLKKFQYAPSPDLKKQDGFALIEVIVSIVILAIVLSAAVGLLYTVGTAVEKNRDRLTATYLAQECLELVRNSRDTAWKNHQKWNCAWQTESSCEAIKSILPPENKTVVKVNDKKTKFSREFKVSGNFNAREQQIQSVDLLNTVRTIANPAKKDEAMVTCTVSWGENDKLSISEILTNWRKR